MISWTTIQRGGLLRRKNESRSLPPWHPERLSVCHFMQLQESKRNYEKAKSTTRLRVFDWHLERSLSASGLRSEMLIVNVPHNALGIIFTNLTLKPGNIAICTTIREMPSEGFQLKISIWTRFRISLKAI
jgi:hypothetical protein